MNANDTDSIAIGKVMIFSLNRVESGLRGNEAIAYVSHILTDMNHKIKYNTYIKIVIHGWISGINTCIKHSRPKILHTTAIQYEVAAWHI